MSELTNRLTAAAAAAQTLATELAALAVLSTTYIAPAPPAPTPVPVPTPPAPTPTPVPQVLPTLQATAGKQAIVFTDYFSAGQSYEREQRVAIMTGASRKFVITGIQPTGALRALAADEYGLLVDGVERAKVTGVLGKLTAAFTLPLADIAEGWHTLDLRTTGEEAIPLRLAYRQVGATPLPQTVMPVQSSSHDWHALDGRVFSAMVPAVFSPVVVPLPARVRPAFNTLLTRPSLIQEDLIPWRGSGDIYRTRVTNGITNPANQQAYYWSSLAGPKYPGLALLDGPRGAGSLAMATHLQVSHTGGAWFCDGWRFGNISADGTIKTLAGFRHRPPAPRPQPINQTTLAQALDLVGDWSAIPVDKHGFHELWGMTWDPRTLVRTGPATVDVGGGVLVAPHDFDPVCFVADAQGNRICKLRFNRFDVTLTTVPCVVTEFITNLNDPWDVVYDAGKLYVSERQANRIAVYDATSGAFIKVLVSGASGLAVVDQNRFVARKVPVDLIRAQPCVLPEGLYVQDGKLYFGSIAMGQVRSIDLATDVQTIEVPDMKYSHAGTNFCKIAVSDDTFGPRGTVFFVTWSIDNQGRPRAFYKGVEWGWNSVTAGDGPGRGWETLGYGCAVAVGGGQLLCSTSSDGITSHSKALPSDGPPVKAATWDRLRKAYELAGLRLTHGPGGYGYYSLPLPRGINVDVDSYLKAYLHAA
jgi:hypothetical protein